MLEDIRLTPEERQEAFEKEYSFENVANSATDKANRWWIEWIDKQNLYWKSISVTKHDYYIPFCLADTWQALTKLLDNKD